MPLDLWEVVKNLKLILERAKLTLEAGVGANLLPAVPELPGSAPKGRSWVSVEGIASNS